eukprot:467761-Pelagomonas_calceolata.AAC.3
MSGQERPPASPAPRAAAPSLLAAPQVLHQSSPQQQHGKLVQARTKLAAMEAVVRKTALAAVGSAAVMESEEWWGMVGGRGCGGHGGSKLT